MHSACSHYHVYAWAGCWCAWCLRSWTVVFHAVVGALCSAQYLLLTSCMRVCVHSSFCFVALRFSSANSWLTLFKLNIPAWQQLKDTMRVHSVFNWLYCCCYTDMTIPLGLLCCLLLAASMIPLIMTLTVNTTVILPFSPRDINWFPYQYPCKEWCCQS